MDFGPLHSRTNFDILIRVRPRHFLQFNPFPHSLHPIYIPRGFPTPALFILSCLVSFTISYTILLLVLENLINRTSPRVANVKPSAQSALLACIYSCVRQDYSTCPDMLKPNLRL